MSSSSTRLSRRAALAQIARCAAAASTAAVASPVAAFYQPPEEAPENTAVPPTQNPYLPDPAATIAQIEAEQFAQALDEQQGYAGWKNHIGKPEEAVVHVRVTTFDGGTRGAGQTTREGSGIICRCDGFVLFPEALYGPNTSGAMRAMQRTAKVELTFRAADGDAPATPLVPVAPPRYRSSKTDYVLVKVNGTHFKGLHLLDVRNVQAQMPVRVVWAARPDGETKSDEAGSGVNPNGRPAQQAAAAEKAAGVPVAKHRKAVVGAASGDAIVHLALQFSDAEGELPPLGAAVIESTSGGVLGIVTESKEDHVAFSPFGYFQQISNEVGLKVSIEDIIRPTINTTKDGADDGQIVSMVKVPGGPTRLSGELGNTYRGLYRTDVVCMPDFTIDAHPVTTGVYRDWLGRGAPRQPLGWIRQAELQTRKRAKEMPVTGVLSDDALRYAAGHNKRLPTPVEWARAGIGGKVEWITKLIGVWYAVSREQERIEDEKLRIMADANGRNQRMASASAKQMRDLLAIEAAKDNIVALDQQQMQLYARYWSKKGRWYPYQHSPVGFYKEDESRWGVGEVVSNTPELCQPNYAARVTEPAYKPYATQVDPYFSISLAGKWLADLNKVSAMDNYIAFSVVSALAEPADPDTAEPLLIMPRPDKKNRIYVTVSGRSMQPVPLVTVPQSGAGFRCAL